jgi:hypothetical protein
MTPPESWSIQYKASFPLSRMNCLLHYSQVHAVFPFIVAGCAAVRLAHTLQNHLNTHQDYCTDDPCLKLTFSRVLLAIPLYHCHFYSTFVTFLYHCRMPSRGARVRWTAHTLSPSLMLCSPFTWRNSMLLCNPAVSISFPTRFCLHARVYFCMGEAPNGSMHHDTLGRVVGQLLCILRRQLESRFAFTHTCSAYYKQEQPP